MVVVLGVMARTTAAAMAAGVVFKVNKWAANMDEIVAEQRAQASAARAGSRSTVR